MLDGTRIWQVKDVDGCECLELFTHGIERSANTPSEIMRRFGGETAQRRVWEIYFDNIKQVWENNL